MWIEKQTETLEKEGLLQNGVVDARAAMARGIQEFREFSRPKTTVMTMPANRNTVSGGLVPSLFSMN